MPFKQRFHAIWLSLTIKKKISFFAGVVFLIIFLSMIGDIWVVNFSVNDFQTILEHNARNVEVMNALENESSCFGLYIKNPTEEKREALDAACNKTNLAISRLPYEYEVIGAYRYAQTWSIRKSHEVYVEKRDWVLSMEEEHPNYIKVLYQVYSMQAYLQDYVRTLMTDTVKEGTGHYLEKLPYLKGVLLMVLVLGILLIIGMVSLSHLMNQTIILPIMKLADVSKKMAESKFFVEDVTVENQDEIGELVLVFNQMKEKTGQYIKALEEKREMASLLHQEELERVEIERRLETTQLELLKNQMNPHFLFNTLNVIGGMANLEEATITQKMIKSLSFLFRYNLKISEAEVVVAQELKVIEDYMYLQQMRFGSRISYSVECQLDTSQIKVPAFSLQPLIENAIIHGLSKKEAGGRIYLRLWQEGAFIRISVADTGIGMTEEALETLRKAFQEGRTEQIGIGLGNLYKRIHTMYIGGEIEVFSKKNVGTVVRLKIQQREREE